MGKRSCAAEDEKQGYMNELVSIVMPVYQAEEYLEETIRSVQGQTYDNWELIAVDDDSADGSFRLLASMAQKDGRIRPIRQEGNGGAARARNTGTRLARGRYLAFLDADDLWRPRKLEQELAFLTEKQKECGEAGFAFTSYEFGDSQARGNGKIVHVPERLMYRQALSRTVIFTSTVLFDLTKIDRGLALMPEVKSEDTATRWRILREGYTAWGLDENLVIYRRPAQSLSSNKLEAVRRIWNLYRRQEGLSLVKSAWYFCFWAYRAVARRL